ASSTAYWINGRSMIGSISLGTVLVAGKNRVPRPATGNTAFFIRPLISDSFLLPWWGTAQSLPTHYARHALQRVETRGSWWTECDASPRYRTTRSLAAVRPRCSTPTPAKTHALRLPVPW